MCQLSYPDPNLNVDWRNHFWKKHFGFIYGKAVEAKKDVVLILGQDHFKDFREFLVKQEVELITHDTHLGYDRKVADKALELIGVESF